VLAALLLHVMLLGTARVATRLFVRPAAPAPLLIELAPESARKDSARKRLLLSDRTPPERQDAPPSDARYFSDRNHRVERETRARSGGIADLSRLQSPRLRSSLKADGTGPAREAPAREKGATGLAQLLDDEQAAVGAENLLNTVQNTHYSFYSRMYASLAPVWQSLVRRSRLARPLSPGDYTVVADLVLDADGNLIGIEFRERSPIESFNEAVIASARKVGKFPNPPRELVDDGTRVRTMWSFTVNVDDHSLLRLAPPRRID